MDMAHLRGDGSTLGLVDVIGHPFIARSFLRSRVSAAAPAAAAVLTVLLVAGCAVSDTRPRLRDVEASPQATATRENSQVRRLARGPVSTGWRVTRIVDGDTVDVSRGRRTLTLRLIGIDTPETVHPSEPIECYGPEATEFARRRLLGQQATLEFDPSQGRVDYYGRTLAYLWTVRGSPRQFNLDAVRRGYALEYTYDDPYLWQRQFRRAEALAESARLGVWGCPRPGS
jgi:endonuclease YncB( thermonuclease family)